MYEEMLDYYFLELQFDFDHVICSKEHLSSCYILSEIRNGIKCQWFFFYAAFYSILFVIICIFIYLLVLFCNAV